MSRTLRCWSALLLLAASLSPAAAADAPLGRWLATEADQKSTSIIELYLEGDQLAGRVVEVVDRNGQAVAATCADCPGELQGQAIVGMRFLWGLHEENGRWTGGKDRTRVVSGQSVSVRVDSGGRRSINNTQYDSHATTNSNPS